jgi:hypothetical protein
LEVLLIKENYMVALDMEEHLVIKTPVMGDAQKRPVD